MTNIIWCNLKALLDQFFTKISQKFLIKIIINITQSPKIIPFDVRSIDRSDSVQCSTEIFTK